MLDTIAVRNIVRKAGMEEALRLIQADHIEDVHVRLNWRVAQNCVNRISAAIESATIAPTG